MFPVGRLVKWTKAYYEEMSSDYLGEPSASTQEWVQENHTPVHIENC